MWKKEKKKSSQNLHDVKKYLGVATGDNDDFTFIFIIFLLILDISIFLLGKRHKCAKLQKKKKNL